MGRAENGGRRLLEWSVAARPFPGGLVAGDRAVVTCSNGRALVAAVDGLGHGPEAALAASTAASVLEEFGHEPVDSLVRRCHEALAPTRGAALTLAAFTAHDNSMTWLGIGNVDGKLIDPRRSGRTRTLLPTAGIAGDRLPPLKSTTVDLRLGDTLVLATDGIDEHFSDSTDLSGTTREIADRILAEHAKPNDDALVVVARYLGAQQ